MNCVKGDLVVVVSGEGTFPEALGLIFRCGEGGINWAGEFCWFLPEPLKVCEDGSTYKLLAIGDDLCRPIRGQKVESKQDTLEVA